MSSAADTVQAIQKALEPYIRPREEAEHIRRVLALNLRSCHENGPHDGPLALVEPDCTIKTTDVRGLQRDFLKALHLNIKAQLEYGSVSQQQAGHDTNIAKSSALNDTGRLEMQVATIKAKRKQERLRVLEKFLDLLAQKPAAQPEYLQPDVIFRGATRLPDVPKTVVSSFTVDSSSTKTDLKALVDRLEKAVLRSKLLLKREEELLEQVKARSTVSPGKTSDAAKLAALQATRNELITWIETELGKASAVEEPAPEDAQRGGLKVDKADMDEQLATIKDQYSKYVAARTRLIQLVTQSPHPIPIQEEKNQIPNPISRPKENTDSGGRSRPAPSTFLMTPYIEALLSVAHEQKASIMQKSHFSSVLAKQTEETGKALARLGEESLLLPEHPVRRRQERSGDDGLHKRAQEVTIRVQPWVSAADAAKLATLEIVAEKIEAGQIALENSTKYVAEIDQLLGRNAETGEDSVDGDSTADDIWLAETQTPKKGLKAPVRGKSDTVKNRQDIWSLLDGNLGLINAEESPRR